MTERKVKVQNCFRTTVQRVLVQRSNDVTKSRTLLITETNNPIKAVMKQLPQKIQFRRGTNLRPHTYSKVNFRAARLPFHYPACLRPLDRSAALPPKTRNCKRHWPVGIYRKAILLTPAQVGLFFDFWESLKALRHRRTHIEMIYPVIRDT